MGQGVGQRIRELRTELNRPQSELVVPGLLSASYLSLIESGKRRPSPEVLRHLAERLGSTTEFLATGEHPVSWYELERRLTFAEMKVLNGSAEEALADFDAVLAGGRRQLRDRAALGRARALELCGRSDEAAEEFEALWRQADPGTTMWAERATDVVRCARDSDDLAYAIEVGEQAMSTFEALDLEWADASIRLGVTLADAYRCRGDVRRARRLLERLMELAERLDSPVARGSAYWNAALVASDQQRHADAALLAERAMALLAETEYVRNVATLRSVYGELLIPSDPVRARRILGEARERLIAMDVRGAIGECEDRLARAALRLGEVADALRWSELACERLTGTGHATWTALAYVTRAEIAHLRGEDAELESALATVDQVLEHRPATADTVRAWGRVAALHEERGDAARALRAYRDALAATGTPPPDPLRP
ncbi:helix-turn-helix domain-containing protein [Nonomuraea phyllanthi]|nr:helix-turn-helix transcriptional regulator [Nonomuraea phyllanthi]